MISHQYIWNLALLSTISFGSHFSHSSLAVFGVYLIEDNVISPAGLGVLYSSSFVSSLFLPLLIGFLIDSTKRVKVIALSLLFLTAIGQAIFVMAIFKNLFYLALVAQVIFGSGASSVTAVQRISIAHYIKTNETFATGFYVAVGGVAKLLGKVVVGPAATDFASYKKAMVLPVCFCALSFLCYALFVASNMPCCSYCNLRISQNQSSKERIGPPRSKSASCQLDDTYGAAPAPSTSFIRSLQMLSARFYWMAVAHMLYILVLHILFNFLPHYATLRWGFSPTGAGFLACLPPAMTIVIAPSIGLFVTRYGRAMHVACLAACMVCIAFLMLLLGQGGPWLPVFLLALSNALLPTILLAQITLSLTAGATGVAFGVVEVLDCAASLVGNVAFGWLFDFTESYQVGIAALFVCSLLGLIMLLWLLSSEGADLLAYSAMLSAERDDVEASSSGGSAEEEEEHVTEGESNMGRLMELQPVKSLSCHKTHYGTV